MQARLSQNLGLIKAWCKAQSQTDRIHPTRLERAGCAGHRRYLGLAGHHHRSVNQGDIGISQELIGFSQREVHVA